MKANFNLALRVNPQTKEKQWYAVPAGKGALDADETAAMAVADTTLSKGEYKHAMEATSEKLISLVLSGVTITIGDLGKLRLSFGSKGSPTIEGFDTATMIQNPKFIFTPSKTLKAALAGATFELEGVVENGIKYGSVKSYRMAKGEDGGGTEPGGGGEEEGGGGGEEEGGGGL